MTYRVEVAASAERELRSLDADARRRVVRAVDGLAEAPRPSGAQKLRGGTDLYRLRVGDWRIVYRVEDDVLLVLVVRIGHRRDVYRQR